MFAHDSFPLEVVKAKITVRIEQEGVLSVEAGETFQVLEKMETWWRVKRMENDEEGLVPAFCMPSESPTETSTVTVSGRYLFFNSFHAKLFWVLYINACQLKHTH